MKWFLKSSLSIFLAITIIFSSAYVGLNELDLSGVFEIKAEAASESDLTFELNEDGKSYSVIDCDQSEEGEVVIPSTFNDLPVDNIADWTFGNCESITAISIPDSIKTIGLNVFSYCTSLVSINVDSNNLNYSSIDGILFSKDNCILLQYPSGKIETTYTIPDFVTEIGNEAFFECSNLISIEIPITVTAIGYGAFCGCSNLKSLQIPNSVTKIESGTFYECSNLENFVISNTVTSIGNQAFELCTNLSSITIGNNVTSIGWNAFMRCEKLASVIIPDSVTSIGDGAFRNCINLTSITIPDSVISIGGYAFNNTAYYKDSENWEDDVLYIGNHIVKVNDSKSGAYEIKSGTKTIAEGAFSGCKNVSSVTIPDSVTGIGSSAFSGCTSLNAIYITDIIAWCGIDFGSGPLDYAQNLYLNGELVRDLVIPSSVTSIGDYAFSSCANLTTITMCDSITSIGRDVFTNCTNLESVAFSDNLISIGDYAFKNCKNIESINIPESLKTIGVGAFAGCNALNAVYITDIASWCEIDFSYLEIHSDSYADNYANPLEKAQNLYLNGNLVTELIIPEGVTKIAKRAFWNCKSIKLVAFPESLVSIEHHAFMACSELVSINIPNTVSYIGSQAFNNCRSLESIVIPNCVTSIGNSVFVNCTSLTSVTIPDSVTCIGNSAFYNCTRLTSITIPDSVTSIGDGAFCGCESLTSIDVDENNTTYSSVNGVLFNKSQATLIQYPVGKTSTTYTLPDSVTSIDDSAFRYCTSLTSITIHDGVTSIGDYVFSDCGSLSDVYYFGSSDDWLNISTGSGNDSLLNATIHYNSVPCSHTSSDWIIDAEASCTVAGSKHKECTECGEILEIGVIPAIGHTVVKDTAVAATCTEVGKTEGSHCSVCGEVIKVQTIIDAKGHTASSWITDKKATVYSAGSKYKECTECGEVLETTEIAQLKCSKPKLKTIENTSNGVKITWGKVSGADTYRVYRKTKNGSWKYLGSTSKTGYTDKTAKSGTKYYYAVRARNEAGNSSLSSSLSKYYLADPTLKTPSSTRSGVSLKWTKTAGAQGYIIYRKTADGSYKKLKTEKGVSNLSYVDKSAKKGKKYTYKVKAYYSKTYSAYSNTKTITDKY